MRARSLPGVARSEMVVAGPCRATGQRQVVAAVAVNQTIQSPQRSRSCASPFVRVAFRGASRLPWKPSLDQARSSRGRGGGRSTRIASSDRAASWPRLPSWLSHVAVDGTDELSKLLHKRGCLRKIDVLAACAGWGAVTWPLPPHFVILIIVVVI